jgi:hypothetical protein
MPAPNATDTNFEKTFSDLAFTRLQDKAPSLLNFLVGFQLIDKNEDDTHAVGVFGFKVGPEWVYAPVFFINGELKGHELLYLKDQDLFVPMVEEWINFILHRRPQNMGQAEPTPRANLGIRQPDFNVFARVPYIGSKYASVAPLSYRQICDSMAEWAKPFMDVFLTGPRDQKYASLVERFDLRNAVRNMGKKAAYSLFNTMKKDATFAEALMKFYDLKELVNASREGIEKESAEKAPKKDGMPKTVVITRGDDPSGVMKDMSDEDKRKLLQNGYVVKDERSDDQKTRIYKTQIAAQYTSPTANGLYGVVTTKGGQRDLLVITSPINVGRPGAVRQGSSLVIDPKTKQFGWFGSQDLMVSKRLDDNYQWQDAFSSDDLSPLSSLTPGKVAAIVTPRCDATVPFVVEKSVTNQEGQTELRVRDVYISERAGSMQQRRRYMSDGNFDYDSSNDKIDTIVLTKKPGIKMNIIGSTIFVPESCRAIIAGKAKEDGPVEPYISYQSPKTFDKSLGATDDIGTLPEVITNLYKTASFPGGAMQRLSLRTDGISYSVSIHGHESSSMSKIAMIKELVMSLGLGCDTAETLVKEARPKKSQNYFVKAASPFQATFNEPVKSHLFNMRAPVQYPQLELQNLGNSSEYTNNRQFYQEDPFVDDTAKMRAIESANMGQKDVLDTSVINGLVKNMDAEGAIDDYISDVMLGMDRLGRLLFLYYWHNDKFEERYGKQDMIQLEGNLRNVFKNTGDVVLFMKKKSIRASTSFTDTEPQLQDVLV